MVAVVGEDEIGLGPAGDTLDWRSVAGDRRVHRFDRKVATALVAECDLERMWPQHSVLLGRRLLDRERADRSGDRIPSRSERVDRRRLEPQLRPFLEADVAC